MVYPGKNCPGRQRVKALRVVTLVHRVYLHRGGWKMIRNIAVAFLLLGLVGVPHSRQPTRPLWIYFVDKGGPPRAKDLARESLSERSLRRRTKIRAPSALTDFSDIPLFEPYVERVKSHVCRIRHRSKWLNAVSVEADARQESLVNLLPCVKKISPVRRFQRFLPPEVATKPAQGVADDFYGPCLAQLSQISADKLHQLGFIGTGILLCMIDTGFYKEHQSLSGLDMIAERDFIFHDHDTQEDPSNPEDFSDSHGTSTWSAAAGYAPGRQIGPAYGASFLLAKTEDLRYERPIEEDNWVAAVEWADSAGADVISSSLSYTVFDDGSGYDFGELDGNTATTTIAADRAAALGIAVIIAAGNYRTNSWGHIGTPADADSVIAVGAVDASGLLASFSSPGPTADGRLKPEVCARGVSTYCADNGSPTAYGTGSGTSLSTPLVAGAAALLLQIHPEWSGMDVREALLSTASQSSTPDNDYGWGIIDAFKASGLQAVFLALESFRLDDDMCGQSAGNGNGFPEPGERIELGITLTNEGSIESTTLRAHLTSGSASISLIEGELTVSPLSPGETRASSQMFVLEIAPGATGGTVVPLTLIVKDMAADTMLVHEIEMTIVDLSLLWGSVVETGAGNPIGEAEIRIINRVTGNQAASSLAGSDGAFVSWIEPGSYAVQARKDGYVSQDAHFLDLGEEAEISLELSRPILSIQEDTLRFSAERDSSFLEFVGIRNAGTGILTLSTQIASTESVSEIRPTQWIALRNDPVEGFKPDIIAVHAKVGFSTLHLRVQTTESWVPSTQRTLVIGLDTDGNPSNGLVAAGLQSDFRIRWSSDPELYKIVSGRWWFEAFLEGQRTDTTLTVAVPADRLVFGNHPMLNMAIVVENSLSDPVITGDRVPDDGGSEPISWALAGPQWISTDSSFISLAQGEERSAPLFFFTSGLASGIHRGEIIFQGGLQSAHRLPLLLTIAGSSPPPDHLILGPIAPNPTTGAFRVKLHLSLASVISLSLFDMAGRETWIWNLGEQDPGIFWQELEIPPHVPAGIYTLHVESDAGSAFGGVVVRY